MTKAQDMPFLDIFSIIEDEKKKWTTEKNQTEIRKSVRLFMDNALKNTVLKICGFEICYSYNTRNNAASYRVDHCNGRSGNSIIGQMIRDEVKDVVKEALMPDPILSPEEIAQIRKEVRTEYIKVYKNTLIYQSRKVAEQHAHQFIRDEVDQALKGDMEKFRLVLQDQK